MKRSLPLDTIFMRKKYVPSDLVDIIMDFTQDLYLLEHKKLFSSVLKTIKALSYSYFYYGGSLGSVIKWYIVVKKAYGSFYFNKFVI